MKKLKSDEIEDFAKVSEMNYQPVEDDETEKVLKVVCKGAAWGVFAGLVYAQLPANENILFGHYVRDGGLVILAYCGIGLVIGALAGWLCTLMPEKNGA